MWLRQRDECKLHTDFLQTGVEYSTGEIRQINEVHNRIFKFYVTSGTSAVAFEVLDAATTELVR